MAEEFGEYGVQSGSLVDSPFIGWESWDSPIPRAGVTESTVVQGHLDHRLVTDRISDGWNSEA